MCEVDKVKTEYYERKAKTESLFSVITNECIKQGYTVSDMEYFADKIPSMIRGALFEQNKTTTFKI